MVENVEHYNLESEIKVENVEIQMDQPLLLRNMIFPEEEYGILPEITGLQVKAEVDPLPFGVPHIEGEESDDDADSFPEYRSKKPDSTERFRKENSMRSPITPTQQQNKKKSSVQKIKCIYCNLVFEKKEHQMIHMKLMHRNLETTIQKDEESCVVCKMKIIPRNSVNKCVFCSKSVCLECAQRCQEENLKLELSGSGLMIICSECSVRNCFVACKRINVQNGFIPEEEDLRVQSESSDDSDPEEDSISLKRTVTSETFNHSNRIQLKIKKKQSEIKCVYCEMTFQKSKYLTMHLKLMHRGFPSLVTGNIECQICQKICQGVQNLTKHIQKSHPDETSEYKCSHCGKKWGSFSNLTKHMKTHLINVPIAKVPIDFIQRQKVCEETEPVVETEEIHSEGSHEFEGTVHEFYSEDQEKDGGNFEVAALPSLEAFKCAYCEKKYKSKYILQIHVTRTHRGFPREYAGGSIQCNICLKVCDGVNFLRKHVQRSHPIQTSNRKNKASVFICVYCKRGFTQRSYLLKHSKRVHRGFPFEYKGGPIECTFCQKIFDNVNLLKEHVKKEHERKRHSDKVFECADCGKKWDVLSDLKKHMSAHATERNFRCERCNATFKSIISLKYHLTVVHATGDFKCPECGKNFKTKYHLKNHSVVHMTDKPILCQKCGKCFKTNAILCGHMHKSHREKSHVCTICSKAFLFASQLENHMNIHKNLRSYQCHFCLEKSIKAENGNNTSNLGCFNTKPQLRFHIKDCHGKKTISCPNCPKKFRTNGRLVIHMAIHKDERRYVCRICGKRFKWSEVLKRHLQTHEFQDNSDIPIRGTDRNEPEDVIERPFKCHSCDKRYRRRVDMQIHAVCHLTEENFKCKECPKAFKSDHLLRRHNAYNHSGEKTCQICGKVLPGRWKFNRHMYLHKLSEILKCHLCPQNFSVKLLFLTHLTKVHEMSREAAVELIKKKVEDAKGKKKAKTRGRKKKQILM